MCCIALSLPPLFFSFLLQGYHYPPGQAPPEAGKNPEMMGAPYPPGTVPPGAVPPAGGNLDTPLRDSLATPLRDSLAYPPPGQQGYPPGAYPQGPYPQGQYTQVAYGQPAASVVVREFVLVSVGGVVVVVFFVVFMSVHSKVMLLVRRVFDGSGS